MRRSGLFLLVPALLVGGLVVATVLRLVRVPDAGPVAPEVATRTEALGDVRFEFEYRPGSETFEVTRSADALAVRRGGDLFEYHFTIPVVNGTTFPSPAAGGSVRWNLDGPLLVNDQPVAPHRFQPRPLDAAPAELTWDIKNPSDAPRDSLSADWSRVGRVLVTAHGDGVVRVWDVEKRSVRTEITPPAPTDGRKRWGFKAAVSPDGKTVAAANVQASAVTLWEADTGKPIATMSDPAGKVTDVGFASNQELLEARDGTLYVRQLTGDRAAVTKLDRIHTGTRAALAASAAAIAVNDGQRVYVPLTRHSSGTISPEPWPEVRDVVDTLGVSPDGAVLALARDTGSLVLRGTTRGETRSVLWWRSLPGGRTAPITALTFFADGKTLAVGAADGLRLYDVESGRERGWVQTLSIRSLAVSGDGAFLAASMEHGPAVLLWRATDLQPR